MPLLNIICYPDIILRTKSSPVENIDNKIVNLVNSMIDTIYNASGIGLAAPQVGVSSNLLVIDLGAQIENGSAITLINPRITASNNSKVLGEEGCLSIPDIFAEVIRYEKVEIKGMDLNGKEIVLELEGLLARAIQHEVDHFNGVLFWDHLGKIKRDMLKRKFNKLQKTKQTELKESGASY